LSSGSLALDAATVTFSAISMRWRAAQLLPDVSRGADPVLLAVEPWLASGAFVQCRLQNVSKTAAELRGFARNSADVDRASNLSHLRANRRIGVRRRLVS
jgi:predicted short-subunit dehydrogenase-like oxidoreductase (DUF2520 family)